MPFSEFTQRIENQQFEPVGDSNQRERAEDLPVFALRAGAAPEQRFDFNGPPVDFGQTRPTVTQGVPETHGPLPPGVAAAVDSSQSLSALSDLRPLGQIHDSFIIAAGRDGLWIIDQHVAHERILFEKVLRQQAEGRVERQQLLMPILLELSAAQQVEYARIADELERMGFESEPFGTRTIAVKGAPAGVGPADIEKLIFEILEIAERELRKVSLDDLRRSMAASIACRAAIKINMRLDQTKMEWLLNALAATECPMSCPHGRPIALRYSTRDILKSFHRI
jgi:DNA mismatch repair protein MutL